MLSLAEGIMLAVSYRWCGLQLMRLGVAWPIMSSTSGADSTAGPRPTCVTMAGLVTTRAKLCTSRDHRHRSAQTECLLTTLICVSESCLKLDCCGTKGLYGGYSCGATTFSVSRFIMSTYSDFPALVS